MEAEGRVLKDRILNLVTERLIERKETAVDFAKAIKIQSHNAQKILRGEQFFSVPNLFRAAKYLDIDLNQFK